MENVNNIDIKLEIRENEDGFEEIFHPPPTTPQQMVDLPTVEDMEQINLMLPNFVSYTTSKSGDFYSHFEKNCCPYIQTCAITTSSYITTTFDKLKPYLEN